MYYILENKIPVSVDIQSWSKWHTPQNKRVAFDQIGEVDVSTVFLGLDHGFGGQPILFETMIFGGPSNEYCERYHTYEEAEEGHKRIAAMVQDGINLDEL